MYVWATPVHQGGRVYLGTQPAHLYALDAASGKVLWERKLQGEVDPPGHLREQARRGELPGGAFDLHNRRPVRRKIRLEPGDFVRTGHTVVGNQACFASPVKLYAIRCD